MDKSVKKKATYYRKKYNTVNPFKIADALGIEVMVCDIGTRLGCYMYIKKSKCIWINELLEEKDRLFVMAHELGHAVLHPKENCYFLRNHTLLNTRVEQEANQFAVELLISDDMILEAVQNQYTLDQCSRLWGYREEFIKLRLK